MDKIMSAIKGLELPLNKKNDLVNAIKKSGANSGGNGVIIVDNVNKLDPNAKLGSMASVVTAGSIQETSFRNLYQPDVSMIDKATGTLTQPELLSSVSSINFLTPADYSGVTVQIILAPRTFSMTDLRMAHLAAVYSSGVLEGVAGYYINQATGEEAQYLIGQVVDGVYTLDDTGVTAINNILASDDWCYLGYEVFDGVSITEEQFATLDKFAIAVAGVPSITDIYVKGDKWAQLYKNDLAKLATSIDELSNKADPMMVQTLYNKQLSPNTYYTATNSSTGVLTYVLIAPTDTTKYSEYILELKCTSTPSSVSFTNESGTTLQIKWANTFPTFEEGYTYLISIANNFGVFAQYIN